MPKKPQKSSNPHSDQGIEKQTVIYKPIEAISGKTRFPEERLDGLSLNEGWQIFQGRQKEIDTWGTRLSAYMKKRHKNPRIIQHGKPSTRKVLEKLIASDTVYIHSHGNSGMIGLKPYCLDEMELAKRLESDGLPKENTPRLKIWACYSGEPKPWDAETTFAREVGKSLKELGYSNFSIFGYRGKVLAIKNARQKHKLVQDSKDENLIETAKKRRVGYDF
jgi:hypothetical protein